MPDPAMKKATYDDLYNIPDNMIGEIIDGELFVSPRPSPRHMKASSVLGMEIGPPYQLGRGGPGGWIILVEVEIKLADECNPIVPDLSGWRVERFPASVDTNWIPVAPDWVCEVLSPETARLDRIKKMAKYAKFQVPHVWLVDPISRTLEVFRLESGKWVRISAHAEDEKVRVEPFQEIELDLALLWE